MPEPTIPVLTNSATLNIEPQKSLPVSNSSGKSSKSEQLTSASAPTPDPETSNVSTDEPKPQPFQTTELTMTTAVAEIPHEPNEEPFHATMTTSTTISSRLTVFWNSITFITA